MQAKAYHCLPSELLRVEDDLAAYCLNNAVWTFGSALEADMDAVKGKKEAEVTAKRTRIFEQWIPKASDASTASKPARKFRDPAVTR